MNSLEYLKSRSSPNALGLIAEDRAARHVLIAWTLQSATCKPWEIRKAENEWPLDDLVTRLWDTVAPEPNFEAMGRIAREPVLNVRDRFEMLKYAALIYPDGTAYEHAMNVVTAAAMKGTRKIIGGKS